MGRFGDDDDTALNQPAQGHLRHRLAVLAADFGQNRVREEAVAALGQRTPRHDARAELLHDALRLPLLVEDVRFDLIDRRDDLHIAGQVDEVVGVEVRNADSPQFSLLVRLLQCAVCTVAVAEGLVQQHQVDVVGLQAAQALVDGGFGLFVTVVGDPHFRHEENLSAVDAAAAHGVAHALFVMVSLRRVNHAVADAQRIRNATLALGGRNLIDAVTHLRHLDAVVQFDRFHILNYDRLFRRQNYALSFRALLYKFRFILLFLRLGATPCTKNRNNCNSSRISCKSVVEETR